MIPALMALAVVAAGTAPASLVDGVWHNPENGEGCLIGVNFSKTLKRHCG